VTGEGASGGDAGGGGVTGDEAAWRDLVARYDVPAGGDPAAVPWPDRENLTGRDGQGDDRTRVIRPAAPPPRDPVPVPDPEAEDDDEHYVPPPPPPLPRLDPVAKGAWAALFGGPAYLVLTSILGWTVPGWAALLAVMAFVGGFAVVVLRMGDGPSRGEGPDNGAVL
jgi:hypothetical protein